MFVFVLKQKEKYKSKKWKQNNAHVFSGADSSAFPLIIFFMIRIRKIIFFHDWKWLQKENFTKGMQKNYKRFVYKGTANWLQKINLTKGIPRNYKRRISRRGYRREYKRNPHKGNTEGLQKDKFTKGIQNDRKRFLQREYKRIT